MTTEHRKTAGKKQEKLPGVIGRLSSSPWIYLLFFLFVFLIYSRVFTFTLGKLDEDLLIIRPLDFLKNLHNLPKAFSKDPFLNDHGSFYRPLQTISFMVDAQFYGQKGTIFYITNLLFHAATGCALFSLFTLISRNRTQASLFTLLYLSHPMFVNAVAWAPGRGDLMAGLFSVLTILFFIHFIENGDGKQANDHWMEGIMSAGFYGLALFSKETSFMVIPVLIIYVIITGTWRKIMNPAFLAFLGGLVSLTALFFFLRSRVIIKLPSEEFGILSLIHGVRAIPEYISGIFFPAGFAPMPAFSLFKTFTGTLIMVFILFRWFKKREKNFSLAGWGLAWFLLFLLPGLAYSHPFGHAAYDYLPHRVYLPAAGVAVFLLIMNPDNPTVFWKQLKSDTLIILLIPVFTILSVWNIRYFSDPLSYFSQASASNPQSAMALYNRGCFLADRGDYANAITDFTSAVNLKPGYAQAWLNRGVMNYNRNEKSAAIADYRRALQCDSALFQAQFNLASTLFESGNMDESLYEYDKAIRLMPAYAPAYSRRGFIWFRKNEYPKAVADFSQALKYDSADDFSRVNRGRSLFLSGDTLSACADWKLAADHQNQEAVRLIQKFCR